MIKNKNIIKKITAFTLAEAMIFLLIATLIMVAAMPVITRKHITPMKALHGKWVSKVINGQLQCVSLGDSNQPVPADDSPLWSTQCEFPQLPESVKNLMVFIVGGGAAGSYGSVNVDEAYGTPDLLFRDCEVTKSNGNMSCVEEKVIDRQGKYTVTINGSQGAKAYLHPSYDIWLKYGSQVINHCKFDRILDQQLPPSPSVSFDIVLYPGDKLRLEYTNPKYKYTAGVTEAKWANNINNNDLARGLYSLCIKTETNFGSNAQTTEGCMGGKEYNTRNQAFPTGMLALNSSYSEYESVINTAGYEYCDHRTDSTYKYNGENFTINHVPINMTPGDGGLTKVLYLVRNNEKKALLRVYGGGGSYYFSAFNTCAYTVSGANGEGATCRNRYMPAVHDPYSDSAFYEGDPKKSALGYSLLEYGNLLENLNSDLNTDRASTIAATTRQLSMKGGCGGGAGETKIEFIGVPKDKNFNIVVGSGANVPGTNGSNSSFSTVTAQGGLANAKCTTKTVTTLGNGDSGKNANFLKPKDSIGGDGGKHNNGADGNIDKKINEDYRDKGLSLIENNVTKTVAMYDLSNEAGYASLNGENGKGLGAGGGGAAVLYNINGLPNKDQITDINELIKRIADSHPNVSGLDNSVHKGTGKPGNGSSGGVIVTW